MKLYQKILSAFACVICLFLIFAFKTVPSGKIWKKYSVLYVPVSTSDNLVSQAIKNSGIKDYVSLSGQYLPVVLNANSPEVSLLKSRCDSPEYSYFIKRNAFFYDKGNNYRLYYIPSNYHSQLNNCINSLNSQHIKCGVDSSASYPWYLPFIAVLFAAFLCYFSKNRFLFGASAVIPVCFVICNPFFAVCTSSILLLLCGFFVSNVWKREGFISYLLSNYAIPSMLAVAFISNFSSSLRTGFLSFAEFTGCFSVYVIYHLAEEFIDSRKSFNPVMIKKARKVSIFAKKTKQVLAVSICSVVVCIVLVLVNSLFTVNSKGSKIMVPSSKGIAASSVPSMNDYYDFMWTVKKAPYSSLNKTSEKDSYIYPRFIMNGEQVSEKYETAVYNEEFKKSVYDNIDILPFNSIESVMKSQDAEFEGHYISTNSVSTSLFSVILIFISLFILLFMYISIIIIKGLRK